MWWTPYSKHSSGPEISDRTVSRKFSRPQGGKTLQELWSRPTTTADFGSSFRQIPHASNIRVLEDKIQDWGMYLLTISYGSYVVDQRSGVGWFSGWSQIFVFSESSQNFSHWRLDALSIPHNVIRKGRPRVPHGGSGMKTGWAHNFFNLCSKTVYSWWQSAATDDGWCEQNTSHVTIFLVFARMFNDVSHDIGSSVCARHTIHVSCAWLCVWSLFDPLFALFISLSHLQLHPPDISLHLPCGSVRSKIPCALRPMRSLPLWPINAPLTCLRAIRKIG